MAFASKRITFGPIDLMRKEPSLAEALEGMPLRIHRLDKSCEAGWWSRGESNP